MSRDAGDPRELLARLLSLVAGDLRPLREAIGELDREDADALLLTLVLRSASTGAAHQLRPDDVDHDADDLKPLGDSDLPPDPWRSGDVAADAIEHGRRLFEAVAGQRSVAELFRALGALEESELVAIVLERALAEMAARRRP